MTRRCAHHFCRNSLDEYAAECPHGLPFCEWCTWEDGCEECAIEPLRQRAQAAWGWTPDEIAAWNKAADCDHAAFHAADTNPHRPLQECPDCEQVIRNPTDAQGWIDYRAEEIAEDRAYELAQLEDREEMRAS